MNEIEELIQFIKKDIHLINQGIQKDGPDLLINIEKEKYMLFLADSFFNDLIKKYCYQPTPKDYDADNWYVPNDRLKLFEKIFLSKVKKSEPYHISLRYKDIYIKSAELLYIRLFLTIYMKTLTTSLEINTIFKKLLADWEFFLEQQKIPIRIFIFLPGVFIENEVVMFPNNFEIRSIQVFISYEQNGHAKEPFGPRGSFLFFTTDLSCNHNFLENLTKFTSNELEEEWIERIKSLKELILSLLLGEILFSNETVEILFPWWFGNQMINYQVKEKGIKRTTITDKLLKDIKELYIMINELRLINDKELEIALHKYFLLSEREYFYDIILDEFIILEFIFSKGGISEVSFRLSSNIAFFLSKNIRDFKKIHDSVYDFYKIRSRIAHGEDWASNLSKETYRKHLGIEDSNTSPEIIVNEIISKLRDYIDKTLRKIIRMKYELLKNGKSPKIMSKFKKTFFIENSFLNLKE